MTKKDVLMLVLPGIAWIGVAVLSLAALRVVPKVGNLELEIAREQYAAVQKDEAARDKTGEQPPTHGPGGAVKESGLLLKLIEVEQRDVAVVFEMILGVAVCGAVLQLLTAIHFSKRREGDEDAAAA
jgi:hypothetical protein